MPESEIYEVLYATIALHVLQRLRWIAKCARSMPIKLSVLRQYEILHRALLTQLRLIRSGRSLRSQRILRTNMDSHIVVI